MHIKFKLKSNILGKQEKTWHALFFPPSFGYKLILSDLSLK